MKKLHYAALCGVFLSCGERDNAGRTSAEKVPEVSSTVAATSGVGGGGITPGAPGVGGAPAVGTGGGGMPSSGGANTGGSGSGTNPYSGGTPSQGSGGAAPASSSAAWSDPAFTLRRRLTLEASAVAGEPTDLVVLVEFRAGALSEDLAGANGSGLRFVDTQGRSLNHEIDTWSASGPSSVWVRLTDLALARAEGFLVYYGNPQAQALPKVREQNVWADSLAAVWHFSGAALDSTKNGNHGVAVKAGFQVGQIGSAVSLNSAMGEHIALAKQLPLVAGAQGVTVSAWVKPSQPMGEEPGQGILLGIGTTSTDQGNHLSRVSVAIGGDLSLIGEFNPDEGAWDLAQSTPNSTPAGVWHFITAVADIKANLITLYVDGAQLASRGTEWSSSAFSTTPTDRTIIGGEEDLHGGFYHGLLDELRVETVARSAGLVAALAQATKPGFVQVGGPESVQP